MENEGGGSGDMRVENEGGGGEEGKCEATNEGGVEREVDLHGAAEATSSDVKFGDIGAQSSLLKFGFQALSNANRKAFGLKKSRKRKKDVKSYTQLDLSGNQWSRKDQRVIVKGRRQL